MSFVIFLFACIAGADTEPLEVCSRSRRLSLVCESDKGTIETMLPAALRENVRNFGGGACAARPRLG